MARIALAASLVCLVLVFSIAFSANLVLAADDTEPAVAIYLSQDNVDGQHNTLSYSLTIYAHLYNIDSQSGVAQCEIDWGDGASDTQAGTEDTWYTVSHTYSSDGVKTISYRCQNTDGYWSSGSDQHIDWDSIDVEASAIPPATAMFMGQDNDGEHNDISYSMTVYANLWVNDSFNDITSCQIDWNNDGSWISISAITENSWFSLSHTYGSAGDKTVNYKCQNDAGTWSDSISDSIEIQSNIPPAVGIYLGEADSTHNNYIWSLTVYANLWNNDSSHDITSCQIDWDNNGNWVDAGTGAAEDTWYSISHTYSSYTSQTVNYRCQNDAGTWSTGTTKHLNWDNLSLQNPSVTAPTITIFDPTPGNHNTTTLALNVGANQPITTWIYNLNNAGNITFAPNTTITVSDNSSNTLVVYGINSNGTGSASVSFNVNTSLADTDAPIITNITTNPTMPFINNGTSQNISINFNSNEYPINITFNLYNSTGALINTQGPIRINNSGQLPVIYTIPANLANGTYTLNMTVSDSLGNTRTYTIGTFTVNNTSGIIDDGDDDDDVIDDGNSHSNNAVTLRSRSTGASSGNVTASGAIDLSHKKGMSLGAKILWTFIILILIILIAIAVIGIVKFGVLE